MTAPTGIRQYVQGSKLPVRWTTSSATASGEFGVWVCSPADARYVGKLVPARGGSRFTTSLTLAVPPGGGYRAVVAYRPTPGSGDWSGWGTSPGWFMVTPRW